MTPDLIAFMILVAAALIIVMVMFTDRRRDDGPDLRSTADRYIKCLPKRNRRYPRI